MSSDSSPIIDPSHYPTTREMDAAPDARPGPPPIAACVFDPAASSLASSSSATPSPPGAGPAAGPPLPPPATRPNLITQVPRVGPPVGSAGPPALPEEHDTESLWKRAARLAVGLLLRFVRWYRQEGFWYVTSMVAHAVGLCSLALISLAIPQTVFLHSDAPSFEAAKVDHTPLPEVTRFEVGDAPLDPTELNAETLTWSKALPIGGQTEKYYDDSPQFEEAGGGTVTDQTGPKLGGLGGFSVKDLPGPGGRGGVGVGVGLGKNPGSGGAGEGFGTRGKGHRKAILGPGGGTRASERAVGAALDWFRRHQSAHGRWSLDFRGQCRGGACSGPGFAQSDTAATAMALLPFLAAGETHKSKGPYQQTVGRGLAWLIKQQRSDGDLSGGCMQPMYAHGLATLALCEAYGMTRDEHVGGAARLAVAFIERAQNEVTGGWRYVPGSDGDTSVFGWQIMALKSAVLAGIPVNSSVFDNAQRWLHSVAKGEHLGLYSYRPYQEVRLTMTAVGMLARQYMGIDPKDPGLLEGKRALMENLPDNSARNTYYWYYAMLVMHNFMDPDWDTWNRKMRRALIETQVKEGCATGSWDPERPTVDTWGPNGGRLMTTSFSTLCLEVYYRYMPLFKGDSLTPQPANATGLSGKAKAEEKKVGK
jgi:hypothetical protein